MTESRLVYFSGLLAGSSPVSKGIYKCISMLARARARRARNGTM